MSSLDFAPALDRPELLAAPVLAGLQRLAPADAALVEVAPIDPGLADTAAFCAAYGIELADSVNCVVVAGKRGETTTLAACMVRATTRADVNGLVRRLLDARKASFAPMELACGESGMEYGGITPVGLPAEWPVLVDQAALAVEQAIVGSGTRGSKLRLPGELLGRLPGAQVVADLGQPVAS